MSALVTKPVAGIIALVLVPRAWSGVTALVTRQVEASRALPRAERDGMRRSSA